MPLLKRSENILRLLGLLVILALGLYLGRLASGSEEIRNLTYDYGYFGLFFVAMASGFNLLVPVPAVSFIPLFVESGLSLWISILVITLGMTMADVFAYALTKMGKLIAVDSLGEAKFQKFEIMSQKYQKSPRLILFLFAAFIPLPNELIVIPAALMGYGFGHIIPAVFLGNALFNILFSHYFLNFFYTLQ